MVGNRIRLFIGPWAVCLVLMPSFLKAQAQITQWPEHVEGPTGLLTVYQPQPEKFDGNMLTARAAVSLTPAGSTEPEFGAMWFHARVSTDRDAHQVRIESIEVKRVKLPNATDDQNKQFGDVITQQIPQMNIVLSLDQLEATLAVAQKVKEESQQLQTTPPKIIFTQTPSTLVVLDGPPKMQDSGTAGVMTVVNTPFILLFDLNSKTYYLKTGSTWQAATDVLGQWKPVQAIPAGVSEVGNKLTAQPSAPPAAAPTSPPAAAAPVADAGPTQIVVSEEPAELISSSGPPTYIPLPPGALLYMSNTQSDVFMEIASQHYFVLLSGRWFTAASLNGPWSYVPSDKLPQAFAQIPPDSPKGSVLVSVAGTQAAQDARYDAYIPQTTAIQRNAGANLQVTYDGAPKFVPIEGTPMTYASNSPEAVVDVDNQYYCCSEGVWYQSGSPNGPWSVCTAVPPVIYTMPPSCPIYNTRFCYVYDATPDTVYCGYLPGYTGDYVYNGTVVYGTGYNYPAWYGSEYYAPPYTWGFGANYDYYTGAWGFGVGLYYSPYWFANRHYNRRWFGPEGYLGYRQLRDLHDRGELRGVSENQHNETINRINIYNREENIRRNAVERAENRSAAIGAARENTAGRPAEPARTYPHEENNVYVGHDGAVYRRTETGWESRDAKGWTPMKSVPEAPARAEENHAEQARIDQAHAEQAHVDQARAEQARVDQARADQAHVDQARPEQPRVEQPPVRQPDRTEQPLNNGVRENHVQDQPVREAPRQEAPRQEAPRQEAPHMEAPAHVEQQSPGGLEADHSARMRSAPIERSGGGGGGGGAHVGGGSPGRR
jgi:hypothetical protein